MPAPTEFDTYIVVFLNRGPSASEFAGEALASLQEQHLAHLARLQQDGFALVAGPFETPAAYEKRGIIIFQGDLSLEQVETLVKSDPSVRAGRLQVEVLRWYTAKGALLWPKGK